MLSFIVIVHSTTGHYSNTLVSDATRATTALSRSVSAGSPDFIPSMTVLRADPLVGCELLYQSLVPDRNHVMSHDTAALRAPGSPSWRSRTDSAAGPEASPEGEDGEPEEEEDGAVWSLVRSFRARSSLYLQECLTALAQSPAPGEAGGAAAAAPEQKPWSCLAAALLSALCYVNKHGLASAASATATEASAATATGSSATSRAVLLVFSDGDHSIDGASATSSTSAVARSTFTFADECAFAVAAVQLAKSGVPVFGFGAALMSEPRASKEYARRHETGGGGERLGALAASLGGFTAPRFSFAHVGALLDTHLDSTSASADATERGASGAASRIPTGAVVHDVDAPTDPLSVSKQRRRERLVDHYSVCPVTLPRDGLEEPCASATTSTGRKRKRETTKADADAGEATATTHASEKTQASHLAWLCPHCTAIVYRSSAEVFASTAAPTCPYCEEDTA